MDLKEVKQFLKENADKEDVKAFLEELKPDETKIIEEFKKSQDFKSEIDRANTQAIDTYAKKTMPKLIDEQVKAKESELELKYNPPKDPAVEALQNQIKQMQKENAEKEQARLKVERDNFYLMNLKPEFKEFSKIFDGSIEQDKIPEFINKTAYEITLKNHVTKPTQGDSGPSGQLTEEEYNSLPLGERTKAYKEGKKPQAFFGL